MDIKYFEEIPDVETYHSLRKAVNWEVFCPEQSEYALKNSYYCILARDNDNTVAMGRVVGDGMYFTIVDVMIRPEYQGKRLGASIVGKLEELIKKDIPKGGRTCIQLIAAKGKEGFYLKQGFTALPDENAGPALRKVIYT